MDKALTVTNNTISVYGDREMVRELGDRVKRFLPNGSKMSAEDALSFAQIALAQDLNPFAHEIWFVPSIGAVTGIEGYRKMARRQGPYTAQTRPMNGQEREKHGLSQTDVGAICELYRPDQILAAVEVNKAAGEIVIPIGPVIGVGIKRQNEKNSYTPNGRSMMWVAEKRAEVDALRKAFDITLSYGGETQSDYVPDWVDAEFDEQPEPLSEKTIEQATQEDFGAVVITDDPFENADAAIAWGFEQGAFKARKHAENAYNKLKDEKKPHTAQEMARLWREDVANRLADLAAAKEN